MKKAKNKKQISGLFIKTINIYENVIIGRGEILRAMLKKKPDIKFYDMMHYVNCIVKVIRKRLLEGHAIIIDGFGVLYVKTATPKKGVNIVTKEPMEIVSSFVQFKPHNNIIKSIKELNIEFLKKIIKEKRTKAIESGRKKF